MIHWTSAAWITLIPWNSKTVPSPYILLVLESFISQFDEVVCQSPEIILTVFLEFTEFTACFFFFFFANMLAVAHQIIAVTQKIMKNIRVQINAEWEYYVNIWSQLINALNLALYPWLEQTSWCRYSVPLIPQILLFVKTVASVLWTWRNQESTAITNKPNSLQLMLPCAQINMNTSLFQLAVPPVCSCCKCEQPLT